MTIKLILSTIVVILIYGCATSPECGPFYFTTTNVALDSTAWISPRTDTLRVYVPYASIDSTKIVTLRNPSLVDSIRVIAFGRSFTQTSKPPRTIQPHFKLDTLANTTTIEFENFHCFATKGRSQIACTPAVDRLDYDSVQLIVPTKPTVIVEQPN